jgi:YegS/Rv2252/BmrU family lipid kinase
MAGGARVACIVNPRSAGGKTGKRWPEIERAVTKHLGEIHAYMTSKPRHATELARQALAEGAELVISVGGDGTNNEVLNGLFEDGRPVNPAAAMSVIPGGTGGDFARLLGFPKEADAVAARLAQSKPKPIDVGRLTCVDPSGATISRMFLNITSFGLGGEVDDRVNRTSKALGGRLSFLWASLMAVLSYKNRPVHLVIDDVLNEERVIQQVSVANGQYFGAGMWVAPHAALDDGLFDIVIQGDRTKAETLLGGSDIYKGKHLEDPKTQVVRGRRLTATSREVTLIDMDGEQPGRLPATIELVPRALPFLGA